MKIAVSNRVLGAVLLIAFAGIFPISCSDSSPVDGIIITRGVPGQAPSVPLIERHTPHSTGIQYEFKQGDLMHVVLKINDDLEGTVTFSKFTFYNEETGLESEVGTSSEMGKVWESGQQDLINSMEPWPVPEQPGEYELRVYFNDDVVASARFRVLEPESALEELRTQLLETESMYVPDQYIASELAGFEVDHPSHIPEGLKPVEHAGGSFHVYTRTYTTMLIIPEGITVDIRYSRSGKFDYTLEPEPSIVISQILVDHNVLEEGEAIQIGNYSGYKLVQISKDKTIVMLSWHDGTKACVVAALLGDSLDEEEVMQVAVSMQE